MKRLFIVLLTLPLILFCEDSTYISSEHALFDDNTLYLNGGVSLSHDLMLLQAESAKLFNYDKEMDPPFSKAHLETSVCINFRNNVHIHCDIANIDLVELKGEIFSEESPAVYKDLIGQQKAPLEIKGKRGTFEMITSSPSRFLYPLDLKELQIHEDVEITYGNEMKLCACSANFYKFDKNLDGSNRYIKAYGKEGKCSYKYYNDIIFADEMHLDLCTNDILMKNITGTLSSLYPASSKEKQLSVSANSLHFCHDDHTITLSEEVKFSDPLLGNITNQDNVIIRQVKQFGHFVIDSITCYGDTKIECSGASQKELQTLSSFDKLHFSKDTLTLTATGANKQTCYENEALKIFANQTVIEYHLMDLKLAPKKIYFTGDVKMLSEEDKNPLHFGLASEVVLDPVLNETTLSSKQGGKVLFWNEEENLKISADKILVRFDEISKKETISGVGNVRFTFNHEEEDNFKEIFPMVEGKL